MAVATGLVLGWLAARPGGLGRTDPMAPAGDVRPLQGRGEAAGRRVYYSGCNEARAAGAAPIYAGEPGYRPEMDGDGDGIACEP